MKKVEDDTPYFEINLKRLENKILRMEIEEIMWKEEKKES